MEMIGHALAVVLVRVQRLPNGYAATSRRFRASHALQPCAWFAPRSDQSTSEPIGRIERRSPKAPNATSTPSPRAKPGSTPTCG